MNLSIYNDYSIFDAGKLTNIEAIISTFPEVNDVELTLDFTNCLIDYPATSKLIDKSLGELEKLSGKKRLIAISDLKINNESLMLSLIVWGSGYFDFSAITRTSEASAYTSIINPKLKEKGIEFKIILLNDDGTQFKEFKYE